MLQALTKCIERFNWPPNFLKSPSSLVVRQRPWQQQVSIRLGGRPTVKILKICPVPQPTQEPSQKTPGIARPLCALIPYSGHMTVKCWLQLHAGTLPYTPPTTPHPGMVAHASNPRTPEAEIRKSQAQSSEVNFRCAWVTAGDPVFLACVPFFNIERALQLLEKRLGLDVVDVALIPAQQLGRQENLCVFLVCLKIQKKGCGRK